jgi:hypothetical protein
MPRDKINEIAAFLTVAREQSSTKTAALMGVTPSALSHTVKGLEERLGSRLLSLTTRSVATTEAGERLQRRVGPLMEQINAELDTVGALRDRPAGNIRITCSDAFAQPLTNLGLVHICGGRIDHAVAISKGRLDCCGCFLKTRLIDAQPKRRHFDAIVSVMSGLFISALLSVAHRAVSLFGALQAAIFPIVEAPTRRAGACLVRR